MKVPLVKIDFHASIKDTNPYRNYVKASRKEQTVK